MIVAEEILSDVDVEASLLNDEVVRRALKLTPCCPYSEDPVKFSRILNDYIKAKRIARSANMRQLDPLTWKEKRDGIVWRIRQNRFAYAGECNEFRDELRHRLKAIWPCSKCISKYNPTGKERPWLM